jgi:YedE family putative selenium metabolism protein
MMDLRASDASSRRVPWWGLALVALVGVASAGLVFAGNPGHMGICGACFLRDAAGSLGLFDKGPIIFRPEIVGLALGALLLRIVKGGFTARSGSHAVSRFLLGVLMAMGALVFLGCPFRLLQRLGGGDLNALVGAVGLIAGVGAALLLERRGYSVGRTAPAPKAVGLAGIVAGVVLLGLFLAGVLRGPGPGETTAPAHAPWAVALGVAVVAGAVLSATGFCAISAARQVFARGGVMLAAAGVLVLGYGIVAAATGRFTAGFESQPIAHSEHLWNVLSMALVGLTGALAGGCPVRQLVMTGEGNGDAFVTVAGLAAGGALAHNFGLVSSAAGATDAGHTVVVAGLVLALLYGWSATPAQALADAVP